MHPIAEAAVAVSMEGVQVRLGQGVLSQLPDQRELLDKAQGARGTGGEDPLSGSQ